MPETIADTSRELLGDVVDLPDEKQYRIWVPMFQDLVWVIAHGNIQGVEYIKCILGTEVVWVRSDKAGWES